MKKKKLLIVESPAKIKTISKFLGNDFKIMSTVGHVKDLPKKKSGVTINGGIDIEYVILDGKENIVAQICREAAKAETIYLAPDPDREGEIIAWHIAQEISKVVKDKNKIVRITFNEITEPAILDAIAHPQKIDAQRNAPIMPRRIVWDSAFANIVIRFKTRKGPISPHDRATHARIPICTSSA